MVYFSWVNFVELRMRPLRSPVEGKLKFLRFAIIVVNKLTMLPLSFPHQRISLEQFLLVRLAKLICNGSVPSPSSRPRVAVGTKPTNPIRRPSSCHLSRGAHWQLPISSILMQMNFYRLHN